MDQNIIEWEHVDIRQEMDELLSTIDNCEGWWYEDCGRPQLETLRKRMDATNFPEGERKEYEMKLDEIKKERGYN